MLQWDIPQNWGLVRLGDVAPEMSSQVLPKNEPNRTFNYWSLDAISQGQIDEPSPNYVLGSTISSTCVSFTPNHVLYAKLRPYLNKVIVPSLDGVGSTEWVALAPNQSVLDRKYLGYLLRTINFVQHMTESSTGARMPRARKDVLFDSQIPIPFPNDPARSLETQRRIVLRLESLLAEVKSARELQENIEEETNLLIEAVLRETFADRDEWQNEKPLGELVSIEAPLVDPREPEYANLPHIYGASIEGGTGRLLEYHTAAEDGMKSSKYLFEPGVVLYSKIRPYLRKVTIADFRGVCSADMYPLTITSEEMLPEFLMWTLLSPEFTEYINQFSIRARIPKVNREQLMSYRMRYPDISNQKKIAAYIQNWREEVGEMQRAQNENAELLAQTEQSFLSQAFRGEL